MNFLVQFIEHIYNNGNVQIDVDGDVIEFVVKGNKFEGYLYSDDTFLFPTEIPYDDFLVYMAALVIESVYPDNNITISSKPVYSDQYYNLLTINNLYDIFSTMLMDDPFYHQRLFGNNSLSVMVNHFKDNCKVRSGLINIDDIKKSLCMKQKDFYNLNKRISDAMQQIKALSDDHISENVNATSHGVDTSLLDNLNLTYEFIDERDFIINPAIGREKEIRELGSVLLTPSSSVLLTGPSGVGKSAIIEGLVYAIKNNQVSDELKNIKILKISPTSIISGCTLVGQFEEKMEAVVKFLKSNPNVVLYMDELHSIVNKSAGGTQPVDIVNFLKTHLENGSVRMIGATTIEEYNDYLKRDSAFTRRFKLISVDEPDKKTLKDIMNRSIEKYEKITGVSFEPDMEKKEFMVEELLVLTDKCCRKKDDRRYNPALVLKVIESAFGYARYDKKSSVGVECLSEAIENCSDIVDEIKERISMNIRSLDSQQSDVRKLSLNNKSKRRRFNPNFNNNLF